MTRGTLFVVGELARLATEQSGCVATLFLTSIKGNRSRAEDRYKVQVRFSTHYSLGAVAIDDKNGYEAELTIGQVAGWLQKNLSSKPCTVEILLADAAYLGVGFSGVRLQKRIADFAAEVPESIETMAAEKVAKVAAWLPSVRKASVVASAQSQAKNAALIRFLQGNGYAPEPEL